MIRERITDPWKEVSWDEAIGYAASRFKAIQEKYGRTSIGGITSSRCTNEEVFVVQKMIRAAFSNNNVDTCARVCHSPTGYGLSRTFGTSAGTQDFKSVDASDVIVRDRRQPDGRPPRLRLAHEEAPARRCEAHRHRSAPDRHRRHRPTSRRRITCSSSPAPTSRWSTRIAHVILTEGLENRAFIAERCDPVEFARWEAFIKEERNSPEALEADHRRSGGRSPRRGPALCHGRQWRHLLRPRRHRAQPGLHHGHGHGQPRHGHRQRRAATASA